MRLVDQLLSRLQQRHLSTADKYWKAIDAVARDVGGKQLARLVDDIEATSSVLGRSPQAVEADIEAMREHHSLFTTEEDLAQAQRQLRVTLDAHRDADTEAIRLRRQAVEILRVAEQNLHAADAHVTQIERQVARLRQVRSQLAKQGHVGFVALRADEQREHQEESLRNELASVDREIATGGDGPRGPALLAQRSAIAARLQQLVGGPEPVAVAVADPTPTAEDHEQIDVDDGAD